jgi:hypothetical protein
VQVEAIEPRPFHEGEWQLQCWCEDPTYSNVIIHAQLFRQAVHDSRLPDLLHGALDEAHLLLPGHLAPPSPLRRGGASIGSQMHWQAVVAPWPACWRPLHHSWIALACIECEAGWPRTSPEEATSRVLLALGCVWPPSPHSCKDWGHNTAGLAAPASGGIPLLQQRHLDRLPLGAARHQIRQIPRMDDEQAHAVLRGLTAGSGGYKCDCSTILCCEVRRLGPEMKGSPLLPRR